jgi:hypothetical protein
MVGNVTTMNDSELLAQGFTLLVKAFGDASIKTWIYRHATFSFCAWRGGAMRGGGAKAGKGNN